MVSEGSPGMALSQQGLKAGHKVDNSEFKLEKGTKTTAMHMQELRAYIRKVKKPEIWH